MSGLRYLFTHTIKNRIKQLATHPGQLILYLVFAAILVLTLVGGALQTQEPGKTFGSLSEVTAMAYVLYLFVFVSIVCFAAMVVILFTRCMTIAMTNARVYDDLRHLGASSAFLRRTVKGQISRVFFVPLCTGTLLIYAFFAMILYFNSGSFTPGELAGLANCALVVLVLSLFLYGMYRFTLGRVCSALSIRSSSRPR